MSNSDNEIDNALGGQSGVASAATTPAAPAAAANVPADLAAIQAMVDAGVVVGADPEPAIPAAQRRAQIEAELAAKGQKPVEPQPEPDSESSSEFESSSEEESDDEQPKDKSKPRPLTNEEQKDLRDKLDKFYGYEVMSDSEEEELDEEEDAELAMMEAMGLDDDSGPVMSAHEQPLPPVSAPPIAQLPADMPTTCAGEIVSWMKDKAVENWLAKQEKGEGTGEDRKKGEGKDEAMAEDKPETTEEKPAEPAAPAVAPADTTETKDDVEMGDSTPTGATNAATEEPKSDAVDSKPEPKFTSSGTLIIKALPLPGYLESGSILATSSGAVLGVVYDTFGPLSQPFYNLRLPPPPYSIPAISPGDKVFVPASEEYRFFVDMNAVRDPRFRSDASNVYDEEVGEDEREWSDDEKEAEAKRLKKAKRKAKRGGAAASGGDGRPVAELPAHLPPRPGGLPVYDDETPAGAPGQRRGQGQGRERGGRGGGGGGRGGRGRGQGRPMAGRDQFPGFTNNPQGYPNMPYAPAGYNPMQPAYGMNPMMGMQGMPGMPMGMQGMGGMQAMPMNMGGMGAMGGFYNPQQYGGQQGGQYGAPQQQQQGGQQGNAPAINPRFAQQYGFWPGQQAPGGQGGEQQPPYSE